MQRPQPLAGDGLAVLKFEMPEKSSTPNGSRKRRAPKSKPNAEQSDTSSPTTPQTSSPLKMPNLAPQISTNLPPFPPMSSSPDMTMMNQQSPAASLFPTPTSIFGNSSRLGPEVGMKTDNNNNNNNSSLYCFLCMTPFTSQTAYTLHLTYVHFKVGNFEEFSGIFRL